MDTRPRTTLTPEEANRRALPLALLVMALYFIPYALRWGFGVSLLTGALVIGAALISVPIHEGLHALGFLIGRVQPADLEIGIFWKALTPYAHCKVPVTARVYRLAILLPGLALGLAPGIAGIIGGSAGLMLYGTAMTVAALGDCLIVWLLRGVSGDTRVQDHPELVGCEIVMDKASPPGPLSTDVERGSQDANNR